MTPLSPACDLDVVIFGGGAAGLWLLDSLVSRGDRVLLLEAHSLGSGQTIASQGIIHGGLKYTLKGLWTDSAKAIREMPALWRDCLAGHKRPDLCRTTLRADSCLIWHTQSIRSRLGMFAAKSLLHVQPVLLDDAHRPAVLASVPGDVYRLDEQVIEPTSFIQDLFNQHRPRVLHYAPDLMEFNSKAPAPAPGQAPSIHLQCPDQNNRPSNAQHLHLRPRAIVLLAGAGNADLRAQLGLSPNAMQRRPLHMALARRRTPASSDDPTDLSTLNGHCVDGQRTRVTVTSARDARGRTVWQIGGQAAEDGVHMEPRDLVRHARSELSAALAGYPLDNLEWSTYRVDRAEAATASGVRPDTPTLLQDGPIFTGWPTKLALAPLLADQIIAKLQPPETPTPHSRELLEVLTTWPRPPVAQPPWETTPSWFTDL